MLPQVFLRYLRNSLCIVSSSHTLWREVKHFIHTHPLIEDTHTHTPSLKDYTSQMLSLLVDHTDRGWSKVWKMTLVFSWIFTAALKLLLLFPCANPFFSGRFKVSDCTTLQKKFQLRYNWRIIFIWPHDLIFVCVPKWLHFVQLTFITTHTYIFPCN